jgi:hypothetical protein
MPFTQAEVLLAQRLDEVARGAYVPPIEPVDEDDADPPFGDFARAEIGTETRDTENDGTLASAGVSLVWS